jgi:hypothetical protein
MEEREAGMAMVSTLVTAAVRPARVGVPQPGQYRLSAGISVAQPGHSAIQIKYRSALAGGELDVGFLFGCRILWKLKPNENAG